MILENQFTFHHDHEDYFIENLCKSKGQPGALNLPQCTGFGEGPDHKGLFVYVGLKDECKILVQQEFCFRLKQTYML